MTIYVMDTSVAARLNQPAVLDRVREIGRESIIIPTVTLIELGVSARNAEHRLILLGPLTQAFRMVSPSPWAHDRALYIQELLTGVGAHRSARLPDLLIAATAEQQDAVVLHYDRDFDTVRSVAGTPCEWVAAAGSLDGKS